ncbi:MAG: hypothetical protein ACR2OB_13060 [Solirubrobacteraceae bacterium]
MSMHRKLAYGLAAGCALATAGGGVALAASAGSTAAALPQLNVTLTGKSIAISGQEVSGGVQVVAHTTGEPAGEPILVRLNDGVSYGQAFAQFKAIGHDPNAVRRVGATVFDATAPKGTTDVQVNLQPGNYIAVDVGGQHGSGPPSGPPPSTTFTISPSAHPAALPAPAATVRAIEFAFRGAGTLRSGSMVRWRNDGYVVHMFFMIRTTRRFPAARVARLLRQGKDMQLPQSLFNTTAGAGSLSWQAYQQQRLDLRPGTYVLACFMDTQDHREHTRLGMERIIKVVR